MLEAGPLAVASLAPSFETSVGRILVVDDAEQIVVLLTRILERDGHTVDGTADADEALRMARVGHYDLILLDVLMPSWDGFELCRTLKTRTETMFTPVVLITGLQDSQSRIAGIEAGADDFLTKPMNMDELRARARSLVRLKRRTDDLESAESVIVSLALTIEARDPCTDGHCQRLAVYAGMLGAAIGLPPADMAALQRGAFLHDVGKVGVPDAILGKAGRLTPEEIEIMQAHTVIGERLCGSLRSLAQVRRIVRHHHERLDGSGYPDGLRGGAIPLLAQVIGVVDVYDALTSERPYKPAMTPAQAVAELHAEVARGWRSAELVNAFAGALRDRGIPV